MNALVSSRVLRVASTKGVRQMSNHPVSKNNMKATCVNFVFNICHDHHYLPSILYLNFYRSGITLLTRRLSLLSLVVLSLWALLLSCSLALSRRLRVVSGKSKRSVVINIFRRFISTKHFYFSFLLLATVYLLFCILIFVPYLAA